MTLSKKLALMLVPLLALLALAPRSAHAAPAKHPLTDIPVSGTAANGNAFTGTLTVLSFIAQPELDTVSAVGLLNGVVTPASGPATTITNAVVLVPVAIPAATVRGLTPNAVLACQILNLVLGPLDLNLLGLTIHLNQVVLNITAVPGAGNLLGNLLCAIANLLNGSPLSAVGTALLEALTALLNQLIGLLG